MKNIYFTTLIKPNELNKNDDIFTEESIKKASEDWNNRKSSLMTPEQKKIEEFEDFLDWATKIVNSWPEWKRNVLGSSSRSTNDIPREPIYKKGNEVAVPDYLLCDRCGCKINKYQHISIPYKTETDPAGDIDTLTTYGEYCNECLKSFLSFLCMKFERQDLYKIGILFKEWHEMNIKGRRDAAKAV